MMYPRMTREIRVWATVVWVECYGPDEKNLESGISEVIDFFEKVDLLFSPFISRSEVAKLRRNEINIDDCDPLVQEVWNLCLTAKGFTDGAFDPWAVKGGFDPSGYVKGWAAEKAAEMLVAAGCNSVQVNAAGDIALRGGFEGAPWKIGVINPENKSEIVQVFEIQDGNIATSGSYEKGAHIKDPHTGLIAIGAKSGTVIGPDGGICDALATALMVDGRDSAQWIGNPELSEYTFWAINRHDESAWSFGPNLGLAQ